MSDTTVDAAYQHVETMVPRADGGSVFPWWHGWAIREAFIAGAKWQAERERLALQAIADAEPCDRCRELIARAREGLEAGS